MKRYFYEPLPWKGAHRLALAGIIFLFGCEGCGASTTPKEHTPQRAPSKKPQETQTVEALEEAPHPIALATPIVLATGNSTSLGHPNDGSIDGAVALPLKGRGIEFNPRRDKKARFGTVELVNALIRSAAKVQEKYPGAVLTVNDIGYEKGGPIARHASHRNGRDVDVLFYALDKDGKPRHSVGAPLDPTGWGTDYKDLADPSDDVPVQIDVARTWAFIEALMLDDDGKHIQRIFLVEHVRTMLLDYAKKHGGDKNAMQRFGERSCQPGAPHDDHFHFRFFCTAEDIKAGCVDSFPMYPWRKEQLHAAGVTPKVSRAPKGRPRPKTVSQAEAKKRAGAMHPSVKAFLKRRESWSKIPHPGRPYCR